ncbi:MAG: hypothetical protein Q9173_000190 [Seirophora scorigena]
MAKGEFQEDLVDVMASYSGAGDEKKGASLFKGSRQDALNATLSLRAKGTRSDLISMASLDERQAKWKGSPTPMRTKRRE